MPTPAGRTRREGVDQRPGMISFGLSAPPAGGGAVPDPGVQIAPPPEGAPPGVQMPPWVAETPRRPVEVVILGPYWARTDWRGRVSSRIWPGSSGFGAVRTSPISIRFVNTSEAAS